MKTKTKKLTLKQILRLVALFDAFVTYRGKCYPVAYLDAKPSKDKHQAYLARNNGTTFEAYVSLDEIFAR